MCLLSFKRHFLIFPTEKDIEILQGIDSLVEEEVSEILLTLYLVFLWLLYGKFIGILK